MDNICQPFLKLLIILGPTASGKSGLAVELAKKYNGEIISADSRQVYRGMDIGTGKITKKEMRSIPHHLLDVADPKRRFTVAQYKRLTLKVIKDIQKRGRLPIICGGTGFYIRAITDDLQIPEVKPDLKLRSKLEKMSVQELFVKLKRLDPIRAAAIDKFNPRRLIRALEIVLKTGKPVPELNAPHPPLKIRGGAPPLDSREGWGEFNFDTLFIGVKKSPAELKKLIHKRLLKRLKQGMIAEVKNLRNFGVSWKRLDGFGLEYRWIAWYLQKLQSTRPPLWKRGVGGDFKNKKDLYNEMLSRLQKDTEHYAKRQMVWFKKYPGEKVKWVKNKDQASKLIESFIKA